MRLPRERFDFSPIAKRPRWKLPRSARVAVWILMSVEEWDIEKPMPRTLNTGPQGVAAIPDVPNWAWHEYGMRVGFWRLLDSLIKRRLRATAAVNANVCRTYEPVARAMVDAGWELAGHGVIQASMHAVPDQRGAIRTTMQMLRDFTGKKPKGWLGPGLAETWETLDLLAEEGFEYVADWVCDDQPFALKTRAGRLVSVPYTTELGDLPMIVVQHRSTREWIDGLRAQFDRLWAEGARQPRVLGIGLHPYIAGTAQRIGPLEALLDYMRRKKGVWFATGEEIYDWWTGQGDSR
jgi:peptidoglycan/xylan/chitin deacetylase (PgdA/CDA1 family)